MPQLLFPAKRCHIFHHLVFDCRRSRPSQSMPRAAGSNGRIEVMAQLTSEVIAHLSGLHRDIRNQRPRRIERGDRLTKEYSSLDALQFTTNLPITHAFDTLFPTANQFLTRFLRDSGLCETLLVRLFFFRGA